MRRKIAISLILALLVVGIPLAVTITASDSPVIDEGLWLDFRHLYDHNGDHIVTFDEFTVQRQRDFDDLRLFVDLDRNDDQVVTRKDFSDGDKTDDATTIDRGASEL